MTPLISSSLLLNVTSGCCCLGCSVLASHKRPNSQFYRCITAWRLAVIRKNFVGQPFIHTGLRALSLYQAISHIKLTAGKVDRFSVMSVKISLPSYFDVSNAGLSERDFAASLHLKVFKRQLMVLRKFSTVYECLDSIACT